MYLDDLRDEHEPEVIRYLERMADHADERGPYIDRERLQDLLGLPDCPAGGEQ